jgi:microcystin-dependent protein
MACSNCFNGCADVISDQCVKYTGVDIPTLGIKNGDNLLTVENAITDKIQKLMDGLAVIPKLVDNDICTLVRSFLPCCPPLDLNAVLTAFLKSICALDTRLKAVEADLLTIKADLLALNIDYVIPACLSGTPANTDTHGMVQAIMNKLCAVEVDLHTNYTRTDKLDEFIDAHIAGQATTNKYNTRMIPWVPLPIFLIPNGAFDANGVGIPGGPWEDVYICNGKSYNGIPDLRGRVIVGSTAMGPAPFDVAVAPGGNNPVWAIGEKNGVNAVPLTLSNLPSHTHAAHTTATEPPHSHYLFTGMRAGGGQADMNGNSDSYITVGRNTSDNYDYVHKIDNTTAVPGAGKSSTTTVTITAQTTVDNAGGDTAHPNIQPGIGAYYIMYIPKP